MLRDRKALLEQEIHKAQVEAANMYLSIAIGGGDLHSKEYQDLKDKILSMRSDLNIANRLIAQGHQ
jgi:hypothetical protein